MAYHTLTAVPGCSGVLHRGLLQPRRRRNRTLACMSTGPLKQHHRHHPLGPTPPSQKLSRQPLPGHRCLPSVLSAASVFGQNKILVHNSYTVLQLLQNHRLAVWLPESWVLPSITFSTHFVLIQDRRADSPRSPPQKKQSLVITANLSDHI